MTDKIEPDEVRLRTLGLLETLTTNAEKDDELRLIAAELILKYTT